MLFDPKWERQTKVDPLSLDAVISWLEQQPSDKIYCYMDLGKCLAAQYNASIGREYIVASAGCGRTLFDEELERIAVSEPQTFGAALARARIKRGM